MERADAVGADFSFAADLSVVDECRALVARAEEEMGGIDILVNCAGINRRKPIDDVTPEDFDAIVAVNMRAVYFVSQAVHAGMKARGGGAIVNISSMSARYGYNTISVYAATKAAVTSMTRSFAREWVKDGIRVNCIEPAVVKTEFTKPLWDEPHRERWFADNLPMGRLIDPPELVGAVIFLASGASSYITGQAITIEGGLLSRCRLGRLPGGLARVHRQVDGTHRWRCRPRPVMPSSISSPAPSQAGSAMPMATPGGVPVFTRSPGSSTRYWLM